MKPWELVDTCAVPGDGGALRLYCRGEEFSIRSGNYELMNSRVHGSEDALAELACKRLEGRDKIRVLIGGLGMGFTLAAALKHLKPDAEIEVAELVSAVIEWNQGPLSKLAGHPLKDARVTVYQDDVGQRIRDGQSLYDAILLDVDNGPEGLTRKENDALYSPAGLNAAFKTLKPGGIFGVWSICPDAGFTRRLQGAGFVVEEIRAKAHRGGGGRHMIWLGEKR